jgi:hypothetical protein
MTTAPNISQSAAQPATLLAPTSSTRGPSTPKTRAESKKISHLSHISAATWIGVGLAFGALVVAVYYGAPMWRLARWTAPNDFRASCISDYDRGLQESVRCKTLLADPAKPPPVVKRTVHEADERVGTTALRWAVGIAITSATLVVFVVQLKEIYTRKTSCARLDSELRRLDDLRAQYTYAKGTCIHGHPYQEAYPRTRA